MKVICQKQTLLFTEQIVRAEHENTGHINTVLRIIVRPMAKIQTVPDWIRDTPTFRLAAAAGLVAEIDVKTDTSVSEEQPQALTHIREAPAWLANRPFGTDPLAPAAPPAASLKLRGSK